MNNNQTDRLLKLDGLRGLLSLVVALNHSFLVVAIPAYANVWGQNLLQFVDWQSKLQQILMLLGNGGAAVTLFFIMSGLVIGLSLGRIKFSANNLLKYLIKRILRLYPVYLLLLIFTYLYMNFGFHYEVYPSASAWYNWWMRFNLDYKEFLLNLAFIHIYIGGVTWTLRVILIASFILPFLYYLTQKTNWLVDLLIILALTYFSFNLLNFDGFRDLRYLYMFYLGLTLPKFKFVFPKIRPSFFYFLLPVLIFLLTDFRYLTEEYLGGVGEALACWLILGEILYGKFKLFDFLESKALRYFGQISYSLYLIHFSVLYLLAKFLFMNLKIDLRPYYLVTHLALFVSSITIATIISHFVYLYLERPSTDWAKRLTKQSS